MELKDVLTALEKVENGAEMIATIKAETSKLSNEAKNHRLAGEQSAGKTKKILEALGLEDGEDVAERAKELKATLDSFAQNGKKPDEIAKQMAQMAKQVESVTKQLADMTKTAEMEKGKRISALKTAKAVDALTKGNAAAPEAMAKLIESSLSVDDAENIIFKGADGKDMSIEDGVKGWLGQNPWAVKASGQGGSGSGAGGGAGADAFLSGFVK